MQNILFVCTGNTCRSPMAAALAIEFFCEKGMMAHASSCGVYAYEKSPASANAVAAMAEINLDISTHSARRVCADVLARADVVITMTAGHKAQLLSEYAQFAGKIYTMGQLCGKTDITDPFGHDMEAYLTCAADIRQCIETIDWRGLL